MDEISSQQQVVENLILTKATIRDKSSEDNSKWENISLDTHGGLPIEFIDLTNNLPYPNFPYYIVIIIDLCLRRSNQRGIVQLKPELRAD